MPCRRAVPVGLLFLALAGSLGDAHGADFLARVDRFSVDGNTLGPLDGTADFVDEFSDGVLSGWNPLLGTVQEQGGFLELRSPGGPFSLTPLPITALLSDVVGGPDLSRGSGSFVAEARWNEPSIGVNQGHGLTFETFTSGGGIEGIVALVNRTSPGMATVTPALGPGLTLSAWHTFVTLPTVAIGEWHLVSLADDAITGDVVTRISYDDITELFTISSSVDDGATFTDVTTFAFSSPWTSGHFLLNASEAVLDTCGDGIVDDPSEACDDAGLVDGDGCSSICETEPGFTCQGEPSVCTETVGAIDLTMATAWPTRSKPGRISLRGGFETGVLGPQDSFDPSLPIEFTVTDGLGMNQAAVLAAGDCVTNLGNGKVRCRSADGAVRARFAPSKTTEGYAFRVFLQHLDFDKPQAGPVALVLTNGAASWTGENTDCRERKAKLACRD